MTRNIDPSGRKQVDLGPVGKTERKHLRRLARGGRGTGRGKGTPPQNRPDDEPKPPAPEAA